MTLATVSGYDVTSANYQHRPATGQPAFYVTGTADIIATPAMHAAYPGAVTINQSGSDQNVVADMYDVETGALTPAEIPDLIVSARSARLSGNGRRNPGAYVNQSNITPVVNALVAAKLTNVPLWVANYNLTEAAAISALQSSSGPYPIIGYQYNDAGEYDEDVWLSSWVSQVSTVGVQWDFRWCEQCQDIFWGPAVAISRCAKTGAAHTIGSTTNYGLQFQRDTTS